MDKIKRQVIREHLAKAERAVKAAKRKREHAEAAHQKTLDAMNAADETLCEAEYQLRVQRASARSSGWKFKDER